MHPAGGGENRPSFTQTLRAFFMLVFVQTTFLLSFKLSQKGGIYKYNTASAIASTELIKFLLAAGFHWSSNRTVGSWFSTVRVPALLQWTALAFMYCANNQLTFVMLKSIGPGQLTLFKSSAPMMTALMMMVLYNEHINHVQWSCISLTMAGLLSVFGTANCESGKPGGEGASGSIPLLVISCTITSACSVVNSKLVQQGSTPLQEQNMMLYAQGFIMNLAAYSLGFNPSAHVKGYFEGYDNPSVLVVLVMQSFMGLAIAYVYKHGGAIIKTLASSVQAALLCVLDVLLFGLKWSVGTVGGTVTVLVASYLYFSVALRIEAPKQAATSSVSRTRTKVLGWSVVLLLSTYVGHAHFQSYLSGPLWASLATGSNASAAGSVNKTASLLRATVAPTPKPSNSSTASSAPAAGPSAREAGRAPPPAVVKSLRGPFRYAVLMRGLAATSYRHWSGAMTHVSWKPMACNFISNVLNPTKADVFVYAVVDDEKEAADIQKVLQPKGMQVERPRQFEREGAKLVDPKLTDTAWACTQGTGVRCPSTIKGKLSSFYGFKRSFAIMAEYEAKHGFTYDKVISTRFDLFFPRSVGPAIPMWNSYYLHSNTVGPVPDNYIGDTFIVGDRRAAESWSRVYDSLVSQKIPISPPGTYGNHQNIGTQLNLDGFPGKPWRDTCAGGAVCALPDIKRPNISNTNIPLPTCRREMGSGQGNDNCERWKEFQAEVYRPSAAAKSNLHQDIPCDGKCVAVCIVGSLRSFFHPQVGNSIVETAIAKFNPSGRSDVFLVLGEQKPNEVSSDPGTYKVSKDEQCTLLSKMNIVDWAYTQAKQVTKAQICEGLVSKEEKQSGKNYDWVVRIRSDSKWKRMDLNVSVAKKGVYFRHDQAAISSRDSFGNSVFPFANGNQPPLHEVDVNNPRSEFDYTLYRVSREVGLKQRYFVSLVGYVAHGVYGYPVTPKGVNEKYGPVSKLLVQAQESKDVKALARAYKCLDNVMSMACYRLRSKLPHKKTSSVIDIRSVMTLLSDLAAKGDTSKEKLDGMIEKYKRFHPVLMSEVLDGTPGNVMPSLQLACDQECAPANKPPNGTWHWKCIDPNSAFALSLAATWHPPGFYPVRAGDLGEC